MMRLALLFLSAGGTMASLLLATCRSKRSGLRTYGATTLAIGAALALATRSADVGRQRDSST
jgi:hypothetical protein